MIAEVRHYNKIGNEINISLNSDKLSSDREVYCKKLHTIKEPDISDCTNCPYFGGLMQGYGHECVWNDEVVDEYDAEKVIQWKDRNKEFLRVSKLIDEGILTKG